MKIKLIWRLSTDTNDTCFHAIDIESKNKKSLYSEAYQFIKNKCSNNENFVFLKILEENK